MRKLVHTFLIFSALLQALNCYPPSWIRKLPTEPQTAPDVVLDGKFEKRLPPFSPLTSVHYVERQSEILYFDRSEKSFRKIYSREIEEGLLVRKIRVEGKGKYESRGNWVLLRTDSIESEETVWKNGKQISSGKVPDLVSASHTLLYHFDPASSSLVPLVYESGYREKPFGVVEGTQRPYAEDERFFISRRNYSRKEYQSHAYFQVK